MVSTMACCFCATYLFLAPKEWSDYFVNFMQELIARRSDMLVMSSDGPISAYVNAHGYVHETLTLSNAYGLFEDGDAQTENSWFPGYAFSLSFAAFSMPSQL
jgi:hypothetical protein